MNEDGTLNLAKFDLLSENERHTEMKRWTEQQWLQYMLQGQRPLSEDEVFEPIYELINMYYND